MRRSWRVVFINIHGRRTLLNSDPGISCNLKTPVAEGRADVVCAWANGPVLTRSGNQMFSLRGLTLTTAERIVWSHS